MTKEQQFLLYLVRLAIEGNANACVCDDCMSCDIKWGQLRRLASQQGCASISFEGLQILYRHIAAKAPSKTAMRWFSRVQSAQRAAKKHYEAAARFAAEMSPLKVAVLKGMDYAQYWPSCGWREFGDLDCRLVGGDSHMLDIKAGEKGYTVDKHDYKHSVIQADGLTVENHHFFTGFTGSRNGRILEKELQGLFDSDFKSLYGSALLSPNVNFTAVFLIAHAQNHFFYEGMGLRQILDWHFFLVKKGCEVDWDRVNAVLEKTGLMPFAVLLTCFCVRHFGLDASRAGVSFGMQTDEDMMEQFTDDLFAEQFDPNDRRWNMMARRMLHRYHRLVRFRRLNKMSVAAAVWRTIAFSSFMHRFPTLEPK